jgi:GxxExxY protein
MKEKLLYQDLSYKIIGSAMQVHTELGFGFLEEVYENALMVMLRESKLRAARQVPVKVSFHGRIVGDYFADIIVEDSVILEIRAMDNLSPFHRVQTLNYLKATDLKLAMLLNFGKSKLEFERFVY